MNDHITETYNKVYKDFDAQRGKTLFEESYLKTLLKSVHILDVGCGSAEPIAKYFIDNGCKLTGVDSSVNMISLCKKRYPLENWHVCDMRALNLNHKYGAIVAWNSFFHLTQADQRLVIPLFSQHVKNDGLLLFTSGPEAGEVQGEVGGESVYHASLSTDEYHTLLKDNGFVVLKHTINDPKCAGHTVWLAQKV